MNCESQSQLKGSLMTQIKVADHVIEEAVNHWIACLQNAVNRSRNAKYPTIIPDLKLLKLVLKEEIRQAVEQSIEWCESIETDFSGNPYIPPWQRGESLLTLSVQPGFMPSDLNPLIVAVKRAKIECFDYRYAFGTEGITSWIYIDRFEASHSPFE